MATEFPRSGLDNGGYAAYGIAGGHVAACVMRPAVGSNRSNSYSGTSRFKRPNDTSSGKQRIRSAVNHEIGIEPDGGVPDITSG